MAEQQTELTPLLTCWSQYILSIKVCLHLPPPLSLLQPVMSLDDMNATNCRRMRRAGWGHGAALLRQDADLCLINTVLGIMTLLCEETKQFTSFSFETLAVISPCSAPLLPAVWMNQNEYIFCECVARDPVSLWIKLQMCGCVQDKQGVIKPEILTNSLKLP